MCPPEQPRERSCVRFQTLKRIAREREKKKRKIEEKSVLRHEAVPVNYFASGICRYVPAIQGWGKTRRKKNWGTGTLGFYRESRVSERGLPWKIRLLPAPDGTLSTYTHPHILNIKTSMYTPMGVCAYTVKFMFMLLCICLWKKTVHI